MNLLEMRQKLRRAVSDEFAVVYTDVEVNSIINEAYRDIIIAVEGGIRNTAAITTVDAEGKFSIVGNNIISIEEVRWNNRLLRPIEISYTQGIDSEVPVGQPATWSRVDFAVVQLNPVPTVLTGLDIDIVYRSTPVDITVDGTVFPVPDNITDRIFEKSLLAFYRKDENIPMMSFVKKTSDEKLMLDRYYRNFDGQPNEVSDLTEEYIYEI